MTELLSEIDIQCYRRDGSIVPKTKLPTKTMAQLRIALEETIGSNPGIRPEQLVRVHIDCRNDEGVHGHSAFASRPLWLLRGAGPGGQRLPGWPPDLTRPVSRRMVIDPGAGSGPPLRPNRSY